MSYIVFRPFVYLNSIHKNILEIFLVIIFSCLYSYLSVYTILIINDFYNIVTLFYLNLKLSR